jgi:hypothetical protein
MLLFMKILLGLAFVLSSCASVKNANSRATKKGASEVPEVATGDGDGSVNIVGGTPVNVPQIVHPGCTATIVGPYTVISAGHCQQNGNVRAFTLNGEVYHMKMLNHPSYPYGNFVLSSVPYDMSIGVTNNAIKGVQPFKLANTSPTGGMFIYGFGCNSASGSGYGVLRRGTTDVRRRLYNGGVLEGFAGNNLCPGDSGGPVAGTSNNIYGINSMGGTTVNPSYYASTTTSWARSFFASVASQYGIEICGVTSGGCGVTEICSYDFVPSGALFRLAKSTTTCVSSVLNQNKLAECVYSVNSVGTPVPSNPNCFAPVIPFGVRMGIDRSDIAESGSSNSATVTITLEQPAIAGGMTFDLSSSDPKALTFASSSIFIASGQVSGSTTLRALDNTVLDGTRNVKLGFQTRAVGAFVKSGSIDARVIDNEFPYSFSTEPTSVSLSESPTANYSDFSVVINQPAYNALTLYFQTSSEGAYQLASSSIPVPIGVSVVRNAIQILDNKLVEGPRSVSLKISTSPDGPAVATLVVNIADDDRIEDVKWQNPINRFDVSGDGIVTPLDVLQTINKINRTGPKTLDAKVDPSGPPYYDVTGDGAVTPLDILQVINELNRRQ